jgi:cell volume regulation protein A
LIEPNTTALLLTVAGALLAASVLFSRASGRIGVPVVLIFLVIGVLAGEEGLLGIRFDNYGFAFRIGTAALVLILFDGGVNTPMTSLRQGLRPALVLATIGVAGVAGVVALGARLLGLDWPHALLVGAIVSSTDAAAVFSMLRSTGLHLRRRVGATLELESGLNDPMAVILTMATTQALVAAEGLSWRMLGEVLVQLGVGGGLGLLFGWGGRWLLGRARVQATGLYPVLTVGLAFMVFGVATLLYGSGFMAVYVAALFLGNGPLPYRTGLLRVHDSLAWLSQVVMFLLLGLLVTPSKLADVAVTGLLLGLFIAFVGRPVR